MRRGRALCRSVKTSLASLPRNHKARLGTAGGPERKSEPRIAMRRDPIAAEGDTALTAGEIRAAVLWGLSAASQTEHGDRTEDRYGGQRSVIRKAKQQRTGPGPDPVARPDLARTLGEREPDHADGAAMR